MKIDDLTYFKISGRLKYSKLDSEFWLVAEIDSQLGAYYRALIPNVPPSAPSLPKIDQRTVTLIKFVNSVRQLDLD